MKALFEVGEEVVLQSGDYPELDGDCVVNSALFKGDSVKCLCGVEYVHHDNVPVYFLSKNAAHKCEKCGNSFQIPWKQSRIRKKYKGVDFNEMMRELEGVKS
jgi:hypothetical protein